MARMLVAIRKMAYMLARHCNPRSLSVTTDAFCKAFVTHSLLCLQRHMMKRVSIDVVGRLTLVALDRIRASQIRLFRLAGCRRFGVVNKLLSNTLHSHAGWCLIPFW
jgi:hypothetical protein